MTSAAQTYVPRDRYIFDVGDLGARGGLIFAFAAVTLIYVCVAYFNPGYDDELFNVRVIEGSKSIFDLISTMNHADVHPPGQYVVNYVIYSVFHSWSWVRIITGLMTVAAVAFYISTVTTVVEKRFLVILFAVGLCALNPSLLLWGTSLRWYSYYTAIFALCVGNINLNRRSPLVYWGGLCICLVSLFYLNYETILLGPIAFCLAMYRRKDRLWKDRYWIAMAVLLSIVVCLPQLYYFITVHFPNRDHDQQIGGVAKSLSGLVQGLLVNVGLFPLSIPGLASLAISVAICAVIAADQRMNLFRERTLVFFVLCAVAMAASGLSTKFRNILPLVPILSMLMVGLSLRSRWPAVSISLLSALLLLQLVGDYDVISHRNTAKGSWNMPVRQVEDLVDGQLQRCDGHAVVAVHDILLQRVFRDDPRLTVVGPYYETSRNLAAVAHQGECLLIPLTYRGALPSDYYTKLIRSIPDLRSSESLLGKDPYAQIKRRFDPDVPDYYVSLLSFGRLPRDVDLSSWLADDAIKAALLR